MKTAVLYSKKKSSLKFKNIGDYIQTVAAEQFFEHPIYINLKQLSDYSPTKKTKLIVNGWFTSSPESWIPSDNIIPLFIGFHITPICYDKMLNKEGIVYLKKWQPIGCRDIQTTERLRESGINAYYSSCLTLTLGRKYINHHRKDKVFFVDPFYPFVKNIKGNKSLLPIIISLPDLFFHLKAIMNIAKRLRFKPNLPDQFGKLESLLRATCFYRIYKHKFTDDFLLKANYISHYIRTDDEDNLVNQLTLAKELIQEYASAKMVITSRIHCALPCLGLETPVIFTTVQNESHSAGRFKGLIDFFRVLYLKRGNIQSNDDILQSISKINGNTSFTNKNNHLKYVENMISTCFQFANSTIE